MCFNSMLILSYIFSLIKEENSINSLSSGVIWASSESTIYSWTNFFTLSARFVINHSILIIGFQFCNFKISRFDILYINDFLALGSKYLIVGG